MELTNREKEIIKKNLNGFLANFKPIEIKKYNKNEFYIYQEGEKDYIQFCNSIDYVNGWLYGAVQAHCKRIKEK